MITAGKMADLAHEGMVRALFELRSILNLRHLKREITIISGSKLPLEIDSSP